MKRSWIQTWANYYDHITKNLSIDETHSVLLKERDIHHTAIQRAQEHLQGVALFYKESAIADPNPPSEAKKDHQAPQDDSSEMISKDGTPDMPKPAHELSDRKI